jgi:type IV pilus assembly protein PilF
MSAGPKGSVIACIALVGAMLTGCVAVPPTSSSGGSTTSQSVPSLDPPPDRATASDETDVNKRARVRMELATAYFQRGQMTTALDEVKQALNANPNFGEAYNLRGLIYAGLGEDALAEDSFRRSLQINPRDGDAMHNYGWYLCQKRSFGPAQTLFQQAIDTPQYLNVSRTLNASGVCQARDGRWAEALATLMRAYERDSANPATAFNLSEVLLHEGQYERARFYIRRVNSIPEQITAQTLWLAAKIEVKMSNRQAANEYGFQLRSRFPQSREAAAFDRGQFDE